MCYLELKSQGQVFHQAVVIVVVWVKEFRQVVVTVVVWVEVFLIHSPCMEMEIFPPVTAVQMV